MARLYAPYITLSCGLVLRTDDIIAVSRTDGSVIMRTGNTFNLDQTNYDELRKQLVNL